MNLKTDELTLDEMLLIFRIQQGDLSAVPDLLRARVTDENFDPGKLTVTQAVRMLEQISRQSEEHVDEVGIFVNKIKIAKTDQP